jgi:AraC-like DNA-binding protein
MVLVNIEPNVSLGRQISPVGVEDFARREEAGEVEQRVAQTVGYMRERLNQTLRVPKLARMVGVSQSHFFALFKKQTGFAPIDLFTRMRMERACELLDSTALNIKEIAAVLGYEDQFYFSRVFKSVKRMSPSEYRIAHAKPKTARPESAGISGAGLRAEKCFGPAITSAI